MASPPHLRLILSPPFTDSEQRISSEQSTPLPLDHPLVNPFYGWPTGGDASGLYSPVNSASPESTGFPTSINDTPPRSPSPPSPPSSAPTSCRRRGRSSNHIKRPMNPFMLFRSDFCKGQKISPTIEHDHRHISRIVAHVWRRLPDKERQLWIARAEQMKAEHGRQYPGYRFAPTSRAQKPLKRKVKRNGPEEVARCDKVAELLLAGKEGRDLEAAVKAITVSTDGIGSCERLSPQKIATPASHDGNSPLDSNITTVCAESFETPPFRSPLLAPMVCVNNTYTPYDPDATGEYGYFAMLNAYPLTLPMPNETIPTADQKHEPTQRADPDQYPRHPQNHPPTFMSLPPPASFQNTLSQETAELSGAYMYLASSGRPVDQCWAAFPDPQALMFSYPQTQIVFRPDEVDFIDLGYGNY